MSILEMKKKKDGVKSGISSLLTVICALLVEIVFFSWRSPFFLNVKNFRTSVCMLLSLAVSLVPLPSSTSPVTSTCPSVLRSLLSAWWLRWYPVQPTTGF